MLMSVLVCEIVPICQLLITDCKIGTCTCMLCDIFSYAIMQIFIEITQLKNCKINLHNRAASQGTHRVHIMVNASQHCMRTIDPLVSTQSVWLNGTTI